MVLLYLSTFYWSFPISTGISHISIQFYFEPPISTSAAVFFIQTMLFLAAVEEEDQAEEGRREMAEILLSALTDRHQQRQTWRDR